MNVPPELIDKLRDDEQVLVFPDGSLWVYRSLRLDPPPKPRVSKRLREISFGLLMLVTLGFAVWLVAYKFG